MTRHCGWFADLACDRCRRIDNALILLTGVLLAAAIVGVFAL